MSFRSRLSLSPVLGLCFVFLFDYMSKQICSLFSFTLLEGSYRELFKVSCLLILKWMEKAFLWIHTAYRTSFLYIRDWKKDFRLWTDALFQMQLYVEAAEHTFLNFIFLLSVFIEVKHACIILAFYKPGSFLPVRAGYILSKKFHSQMWEVYHLWQWNSKENLGRQNRNSLLLSCLNSKLTAFSFVVNMQFQFYTLHSWKLVRRMRVK